MCQSTHETELLPEPVNIHAFLWENLTEVTERNNNFTAFLVHGKNTAKVFAHPWIIEFCT